MEFGLGRNDWARKRIFNGRGGSVSSEKGNWYQFSLGDGKGLLFNANELVEVAVILSVIDVLRT